MKLAGEYTSMELLTTMEGYGTRTPEERIDALVALVKELVREVEALRAVAVARETRDGSTSYRDHYRETSLLSHNSAGIGGGEEKVLRRFIPINNSELPTAHSPLPEAMMLRRLGLSDDEIEDYVREVKRVSRYT